MVFMQLPRLSSIAIMIQPNSTISHCDPLISLISFAAHHQHQKLVVDLYLSCCTQQNRYSSKNREDSTPFQELNQLTNTDAQCVTVFAKIVCKSVQKQCTNVLIKVIALMKEVTNNVQ